MEENKLVKFKITILLALLALCAFPVLAQDMATNSVSFNGFSFTFDPSIATNVNIMQVAGDPVDAQQPGGPDAPHAEFDLYNDATAPASFDAPAVIRVYRTADFAGYDMLTGQVQQLQSLLTDRPDLAAYMVGGTDASQLPFVPTQPASQVIRARAQYIDTASVQGISYVTVYRQDVSPFVNDEFIYTFQGMSVDGAYFVSAMFRLTTSLFPAEIPPDFDMDTFTATFTDYLNQSIAQFNQAAATDFTPSLDTMYNVIQSFDFQAINSGLPPAPQATPTEVVNTDPTFAGLGGMTWTLVSYGNPDSPQAALPEAPVTLVFSAEGIGGSAGCNTYGGGFQYDAGTISFGNVVSTKVACEGAGVMEQESAYLNALSSANSFQISDGRLQIVYDSGVLTFTSDAGSASDLVGVTWNLVSMGSPDSPQPVLQGTPITLIFTNEGVGGSAGCNTYGGGFQTDGSSITFSNVVSTLMACGDTGVMEQETAYLNALNSASSYQVTDGQLQINYNGGVLTFTPATQ